MCIRDRIRRDSAKLQAIQLTQYIFQQHIVGALLDTVDVIGDSAGAQIAACTVIDDGELIFGSGSVVGIVCWVRTCLLYTSRCV